MLFNEIVQSMCGLNEDNTPRCGFSVNKEVYKIGDTEPIQTFSRISSRPHIDFSRIPGFDKTYIKVDIHIDQLAKSDAIVFLNYLNEYGAEINAVTDDSETIPQMFFTFVPLSYKGQYYFVASLPLFWATSCTDMSQSSPNIISILFDAETVVLYETSEIDYDKIISLVQNEIDAELAYQESLYEKQEIEKELKRQKEENITNARLRKELTATEILKSAEEGDDF